MSHKQDHLLLEKAIEHFSRESMPLLKEKLIESLKEFNLELSSNHPEFMKRIKLINSFISAICVEMMMGVFNTEILMGNGNEILFRIIVDDFMARINRVRNTALYNGTDSVFNNIDKLNESLKKAH